MLGTVLMYISIFSPLPGLLIGWRFARSYSGNIRIILMMIALSFLSDMVMRGLSLIGVKNNLPVAHLYGLLEGYLLLTFFYHKLSKYRLVIIISGLIFIISYIIDATFISKLVTFNTFSRTLEAGIMIILSVLYFFDIYQNETDIFIDKNPEFWLVTGILIYFSGAFFSFLLSSEILSQSPERFYSSWILHNVSNIVKNFIFFFALWKARS